jgi:hypothetical protein
VRNFKLDLAVRESIKGRDDLTTYPVY